MRSQAAQDIPIRCPICDQAVLKAGGGESAPVWIRCITDGDFTIAADVLAMMAKLPLATRHHVLNVAIIGRAPGQLPLVDGETIAKGCLEADARTVPGEGK